MKKISNYITEKFRVSKDIINYPLEEKINKLIDAEKQHLFKNISLDNDTIGIDSIWVDLKFGSFPDHIINIDPEYVEQCLKDNDLWDKESKAIYIPNSKNEYKYTYIKNISNDDLEKYDKPAPKMDGEKYDIYFIRTNKYFLLRIVTTKTNITADFIPVL